MDELGARKVTDILIKVNRRLRSLESGVQIGLVGGLRAVKMLFLRTDVGRWAKVCHEIPSWDERNRIIASFIPAGAAVLDLGSGAQTLRQHLHTSCRYQPCDIVQSSPDVIRCDFNSGIYPVLSQEYDHIVCSGVIEYLHDPESFFGKIRNYGAHIIITYNPRQPGVSVLKRRTRGWVNHMTERDLQETLSKASLQWTVLRRRPIGEKDMELFYRATASLPQKALLNHLG